jgi:DNA/RNA-binding domain of Phe-tRNA-synthetase-like protein
MTSRMSAAEWVDRSCVSEEIHTRWPDYRVTLLAADDIDIAGLAVVTDELFEAAHASVRGTPVDHDDPHITRWRDAYGEFGLKPRVARCSVDALVRRARSEQGLPRINTLVDLYNAVSVLHRVPIGGEDLDAYAGAARLLLAEGGEPFLTSADGAAVVENPAVGEPVWVDDEGVTCRRWNWRQTTRTAIHTRTTRAAFIIDSLDAPAHEGTRRAVDQLTSLIPGLHSRTI